MKKQYINPTTEIIDIKINQQLLAGSDISLSNDGDDIINDNSLQLAPDFVFEDPIFNQIVNN